MGARGGLSAFQNIGANHLFVDQADIDARSAGMNPLSAAPGRNQNEMMKSMGTDGQLKILYIMGEDIIVSGPITTKVEARLQWVESLVVRDSFMTETTKLAEKDKTGSNRHVQRVRKTVAYPIRRDAETGEQKVCAARISHYSAAVK